MKPPSRAVLLCGMVAAMPLKALAADYIVMGRVEHLLIYNKYQQEATGHERQSLTPFVPMKILDANALLSDGFTRCMQVEVNGLVFYLLKDKEGKLVGSGTPGGEQIFRNATPIMDTVEVLRSKSLRFTPLSSPARYLPAGESVTRVFHHRNGTYCGTLSSPPVYGWINFGSTKEGRGWKIVRTTVVMLDSIPADLLLKVESRVTSVNMLLARLFSHFNDETEGQRETPRWELVSSATAISCTLLTTTPPEHFQQSTRYLVKDLENIAMGANLEVIQTPGKIDMRLR